MAESTITTKGQCVVPKKIRDYMRLNPGDKIDFVIQEDGEVCVRPVIQDVRYFTRRFFQDTDFKLTSSGIMVLRDAHKLHKRMWKDIPEFSLDEP